MSISLHGSKKLVSSHGRQLLKMLTFGSPDIEDILDILKMDPLAPRVKSEDSGRNSVHLLLNGNFTDQFLLSILTKITETDNVAAIKSKDNSGLLPLHIYLLKSKVNIDVLSLLLTSYPESARIEYPNNLLPLYVVLDKEDADFDVFKTLCKFHPEGVQTADSNGSLPLHVAINKKKHNLKIINQLLKRYPIACSIKNVFQSLPFHYACTNLISFPVFKSILEKYHEAVRVPDIYGKTPLHLLSLAIMQRNEEEKRKASQTILEENDEEDLPHIFSKNLNLDKSQEDDFSDDGEESHKNDNDNFKHHDITEQFNQHLLYIIAEYPKALVAKNNFNTTPIDTCIAQQSNILTKFKKITVHGMFNNPILARILLLAHRREAAKGCLPPMNKSHTNYLKELNWSARKEALLICMAPNHLPSSLKLNNTKNKGGKNQKSNNYTSKNRTPPPSNIFSKLWECSGMDCLRLCISFL